jgi:hypothetical protein
METKLQRTKMTSLRVKLGFDSMFVVDSVGRSGGLALFWKEDVQLEIQNYSNRHINAVITELGQNFQWKLTGFYGHPETAHRGEGGVYSDIFRVSLHCHGCVLGTSMRFWISQKKWVVRHDLPDRWKTFRAV